MPGPLSRRSFAGLLGAGAVGALGGAALRPAFGFLPGDGTPGRSPVPAEPEVAPGGRVRLSSNENPYGPSPGALQALQGALPLAWRYPDEELDALADDLAGRHGVQRSQLLFGPGSSEILRLCAAAATGPGRPLVMADPTFEAVARCARAAGAEVVRVPLTADFRHDLPRMLEAKKPAGLVYLCNPNNPTGSITLKGEVRDFLARVPAETLVLVDEAYFHFATSPDYESVLPLVSSRPNLVVARTFSKVYGLAGIRCGYAVAQAATIEKLAAQQAWDNVSIAAIACCRAALADEAYVERSRRLLGEVKATTVAALAAMGLATIPSQTNFFMTDLGREVRPVIEALRMRGVDVGRVFPALPRHLRVTVGTGAQMERFLSAFRQVMA